jgi:proteasome accessory factor C
MGNKNTTRKATIPQHAHQLPLIGKINPRLNKILGILRRRGTHTIKAIAEELELKYDTAKRAVNRLRVDYGINIPYDRPTHSIKLVEKVSEIPQCVMVPFTESELRVASLGAKALLTCPESGLGQIALKVFEKLSALVPEAAKHDNEDEILTFGFTSKPIYRQGILKKMFDAKARRRQMHMYYETDPNPPEWRVVDIYSCKVVNEAYYIVAYCHKRRKRLTFCATRIWELKESGKTYQIPKTFNLKKYLRGNFGIVGGGKKSYKIVVHFKERAYLVKERKWAGQKKQVVLPDGSVELHVQLNSLWEFERWLKGHPGSFTVLQPPEFREAIAQAGLRMHRDNKVG